MDNDPIVLRLLGYTGGAEDAENALILLEFCRTDIKELLRLSKKVQNFCKIGSDLGTPIQVTYSYAVTLLADNSWFPGDLMPEVSLYEWLSTLVTTGNERLTGEELIGDGEWLILPLDLVIPLTCLASSDCDHLCVGHDGYLSWEAYLHKGDNLRGSSGIGYEVLHTFLKTGLLPKDRFFPVVQEEDEYVPCP